MDKFNQLTTGAKVVLVGGILFLIVSFFEWFEVGGELGDAVEAFAGDNGITMWHGVGWIAGLAAIALVVWIALRLANVELEIGVSSALVTAGLAALVLIFALIRFIDSPSSFDRTFWAWLGLLLAIVIAVGAWMNMQASGESFADVRAKVSGMTSRDEPAATPPSPASPPPAAPPAGEAPGPEEQKAP